MADTTQQATTGQPGNENEEVLQEKKRIPCDYPGCDKSFLRSEHLSRHQLNHYGRTLECEQCGKKFARSDLLHRHIDRHRQQAQKIHTANLQSPTHHTPISNSLSSPYANHRPVRPLSAENISRTNLIRDQQPAFIHTNHHYISNQHVQQLLPSPSHGGQDMSLQPCLSPMQPLVPGLPLPQEYPQLPQPIFGPDIHTPNTHNSVMNPPMVLPTSPNPATGVFDINPKWDHLFQGGGIFEMSSIFGVDSEFGNLTPPDLSLESMGSTISPYHALITAPPPLDRAEYVLSSMSMEKLRHDCPEGYRQSRYLASPNALAVLLEKAFFHLNNNYPIFHGPTMQLETFPTSLTLAIASLGALLSDDQDTQQFGLTLHNCVRDFIFSPIMFSANRELWVLQTMLLLNITGNHLGKRIDHEMSDILQGTMVTLARRNSFIFEDNTPLLAKRNLTDDQKWRDWIRRESIKRFAHFIFINDTQHSCLYGHQGIMSVWEMKLAMPCSETHWNAPTAQEWRRLMTEERKSRATAHDGPPVTLLDIVTAFISPHAGFSTIDHRTVPLDSLGLYAVVHGIFSVAWHFKNRKIPHYWANMMHIKVEEPYDGEEDVRWLLSALHEWKSRYNFFWQAARYAVGYQPPSAMWSPPFRIGAAAMYDLACLRLQAPLGDFQVAAASRFAQGRVAVRQLVHQSWTRINKKSLNDDVCHHALNLLEAELVYRNEATGHHGLHSYLTDPSYPLFLPFVAYLGGLALWAYSSNLDRHTLYPVQQRSLDQGGYHVDSYGMAEYPRLNAAVLPGHQFAPSDDYNDVIRALRGNLSLTFTADGISPSTAPTYYSKSPTGLGPGPSNTFPQLGSTSSANEPSNSGRVTLFRQGTDILLGFLREQLEGHRWEIARESFEILQGTSSRADYQ